MDEITNKFNYHANIGRPKSYVLLYPDGMHRLMTMELYKWKWIDTVERNGKCFNKLLQGAITLAEEFPSGKGYQADILENTEFMLKVSMESIYEKEYGVSVKIH